MSHIEEIVQRLRDTQAKAKLIGHAPAFLRAISQFPAIARSDAAVLISGETGTGKELAARAMHYMSGRAALPFVAVNCGALPDTLLEDELFGHEKGAFTDAQSRRIGLVAQAHGGTLFLDEVDALSGRAQVALLRVLQDKRYRPVGASVEQQADIRILAATNALLEQSVRAGSFRPDLYYRLCVFSIELPPLRERGEDITLLADHFLRKHAAEREGLRLAADAERALAAYSWPGNVRELENAIVRGIHTSEGQNSIGVSDLALPGPAAQAAAAGAERESYKSSKRRAVEVFERTYLTDLMIAHNGNVTHAARSAGKERRDFGRLLKKHRIDPESFR